MKLKDMFISEEQLAIDTLVREVHEEQWVREADEEISSGKSSREKTSRKTPDFGPEPDDEDGFVDDDEEEDKEFKGAPADPVTAGIEADGFSGDPVFTDIPEPSADPDNELWHTHIELSGDMMDSSGGVDVSFPDYEGPKARSAHDDEEPDEKGFYPRSQSSKKSKG